MYPEYDNNNRYGARISALDAALERMLAERARLEAASNHFGVDEYEDGTVLVWEKQFADSERTYTYAAVKGGNLWYVTGAMSPRGGLTWAALTDEMVRSCGGNYPTIWMAAEYARASAN